MHGPANVKFSVLAQYAQHPFSNPASITAVPLKFILVLSRLAQTASASDLCSNEGRNTDFFTDFSKHTVSVRPSAHATSGTSQRIAVEFGSGVTGKLPCNAKSCT